MPFPSSYLDRTTVITGDRDKEYLWNAVDHNNPNKSFADFCLKVFDEDKARKNYIREDFTPEEIKRMIKRLEPTIFAPGARRPSDLQEILDWLKINDLNIITGLSKNSRIFIEGGPGTGKTTIAKAYINLFAPQKGLYLCWNSLLAASMCRALKKANLHSYCDVEKFESFLIRISKGKYSLDDFSNSNSPVQDDIRKILLAYKSSNDYKDYSYIIIDEIHDTLDKGAIEILDTLSSIGESGLAEGRFLVFFDNNQGYAQETRNLQEAAEKISENAAIFVLGENHRVPENKAIVHYAQRGLTLPKYEDFLKLINELEDIPNCPISVKHLDTAFQKYICNYALDIAKNRKGNNYVLLVNSGLMKDEAVKMYLEYVGDNLTELNERNIDTNLETTLPWTTILKYKGLERDHVILALKCKELYNCFEIFIGMTRAISKVEVLIID